LTRLKIILIINNFYLAEDFNTSNFPMTNILHFFERLSIVINKLKNKLS